MNKVLPKLAKIQEVLKVPKSQWNDFSSFAYRSAALILETAKPLLEQEKCIVVLSDEAKIVGSWNYVEATATIIDIESGDSHSVTSSAREQETKKGMDASQITGSASSYARKYALNGLFAIDDTKDADTMDNRAEGVRVYPKPPTKAEREKALSPLDKAKGELMRKMMYDCGLSSKELPGVITAAIGKPTVDDLEEVELVEAYLDTIKETVEV